MAESRTTMGRGRGRGRLVVVVLALVVLLAACDWPMFGYGASHTRYNPTETAIGVGNVASLKTAWTGVINPGGPTGNLFFSSPSVAGGVVYVGSVDHKLYAFDASRRDRLFRYPEGVRTPVDGHHRRHRPIVAGGGERGRLRRLGRLEGVCVRCRGGDEVLGYPEDVRTPLDRHDRWQHQHVAGGGERGRLRRLERLQAPCVRCCRGGELLWYPEDLRAHVGRNHRRHHRSLRRRWRTGSSTSPRPTPSCMRSMPPA